MLNLQYNYLNITDNINKTKMREYMKIIDIDMLDRLTSIEELVIIDIRTTSEYAREHIQGSINIPLDKLKKFEAPSTWKEKTVLFHCKRQILCI